MQKLYCYVDETGLDPRSTFFLVSVVITEGERTEIEEELARIEKLSGKGRRKWMESREEQRVSYIEHVLSSTLLKGKFYYATYPPAPGYIPKTVLTIARAITLHAVSNQYKATVFIDGLPKSLIPQIATTLRHLHIHNTKVRGVRDEEASPLMRLADAICGFVRAAIEGKSGFAPLLDRAKKNGMLREL
jgi:hypothetical protein